MPKVVTFSVFFPSLSNSSAVWAHPNAHQEQSNIAGIFFMMTSLSALLYACARRRETRGRDARLRGQPLLYGHASQHRRFVGRPGQMVSLGHGGADPRADHARPYRGELACAPRPATAFL